MWIGFCVELVFVGDLVVVYFVVEVEVCDVDCYLCVVLCGFCWVEFYLCGEFFECVFGWYVYLFWYGGYFVFCEIDVGMCCVWCDKCCCGECG